ncbi:hypothetical protein M4D49_25325 [Cupriavidus pauculus]|jgi:hypothetical protein|uniref:hypothetical protein n=1 Tax=Cupriavidus TaxID=106589 RepID=UPI00203FB087|nr:hypothetical protein [Cupriavidus pauculus]MCM3608809.1 hypothetical protein [Cupriavidus pauculus]
MSVSTPKKLTTTQVAPKAPARRGVSLRIEGKKKVVVAKRVSTFSGFTHTRDEAKRLSASSFTELPEFKLHR